MKYKIKTFVLESDYKIVFNGHEYFLMEMNHEELNTLSDRLSSRVLQKMSLDLKKKQLLTLLKSKGEDTTSVEDVIFSLNKELNILGYCIQYLRDFMFAVANVKMVSSENEIRIFSNLKDEDLRAARNNGWSFLDEKQKEMYEFIVLNRLVNNLFTANTKVAKSNLVNT